MQFARILLLAFAALVVAAPVAKPNDFDGIEGPIQDDKWGPYEDKVSSPFTSPYILSILGAFD